MSSTGAPLCSIMATRTPLEGCVGGVRIIKSCRRSSLLKVAYFKGHMGNTLHQRVYGAALFKAHPFDAEGACGESGHVHAEMGNVDFPGHDCRGRDACMVIFPVPAGDAFGRFMIKPDGELHGMPCPERGRFLPKAPFRAVFIIPFSIACRTGRQEC